MINIAYRTLLLLSSQFIRIPIQQFTRLQQQQIKYKKQQQRRRQQDVLDANSPKAKKKVNYDRKTTTNSQQDPSMASSARQSMPQTDENPSQTHKQLLKTYTQIIPPHRIHASLYPDHQLRRLLDPFKVEPYLLERRLNKHLKWMNSRQCVGVLTRLVSLLRGQGKADGSAHQDGDKSTESMMDDDLDQQDTHSSSTSKQLLSIERKNLPADPDAYWRCYNLVLSSIDSRLVRQSSSLSLEGIAQLVACLAKGNLREIDLLRRIEQGLVEQPIPYSWSIIRRLLYAYTHLEAGTTVFYGHVTKTLMRARHEARLMELVQVAYMLSKVSQDAPAGFGLYGVLQTRINEELSGLDFSPLTKIASLIFSQNLLSSQTQMAIEQRLFDLLPPITQIKISEVTRLCKATTGYIFKYKSMALQHLLLGYSLKLLGHCSVEQYLEFHWSWSRHGRGSPDLVYHFQRLLANKWLLQLKPRQLSFVYYGFCGWKETSRNTLEQIERQFLNFNLDTVDNHYLIKMLLGMHRRNHYPQPCFTQIMEKICLQLPSLSQRQLVLFLRAMNESDIDYAEERQMASGKISDLIAGLSPSLVPRLAAMSPQEQAQVLYFYTKFGVKSTIVGLCIDLLTQSLLSLPKSCFVKLFFCCVIHDVHTPVISMTPLIKELHSYSPLPMFFKPTQFPLLAYSILQMRVGGNIDAFGENLIKEVVDVVDKFNDTSMNSYVKKAFQQAKNLAEKWKTQSNTAQPKQSQGK